MCTLSIIWFIWYIYHSFVKVLLWSMCSNALDRAAPSLSYVLRSVTFLLSISNFSQCTFSYNGTFVLLFYCINLYSSTDCICILIYSLLRFMLLYLLWLLICYCYLYLYIFLHLYLEKTTHTCKSFGDNKWVNPT